MPSGSCAPVAMFWPCKTRALTAHQFRGSLSEALLHIVPASTIRVHHAALWYWIHIGAPAVRGLLLHVCCWIVMEAGHEVSHREAAAKAIRGAVHMRQPTLLRWFLTHGRDTRQICCASLCPTQVFSGAALCAVRRHTGEAKAVCKLDDGSHHDLRCCRNGHMCTAA